MHGRIVQSVDEGVVDRFYRQIKRITHLLSRIIVDHFSIFELWQILRYTLLLPLW